MSKCSRRCRYFDQFGPGTVGGSCRAKGGSETKTLRLMGGGVATIDAHRETKIGTACPYRGPYAYPDAWEPEHMFPPPVKKANPGGAA